MRYAVFRAQAVPGFIGHREDGVEPAQDGAVEPVVRAGVEPVVGGHDPHAGSPGGQESVQVRLVPVGVQQIGAGQVCSQTSHGPGVETPAAAQQRHRHPYRPREVGHVHIAAVLVVEDLE